MLQIVMILINFIGLSVGNVGLEKHTIHSLHWHHYAFLFYNVFFYCDDSYGVCMVCRVFDKIFIFFVFKNKYKNYFPNP